MSSLSNLFNSSELSKEQYQRSLEIMPHLFELAEFYGTQVSAKQCAMWSVVLSKYPSKIVQKACQTIPENITQKFLPKPAEIMEVCSTIMRKAAAKKTLNEIEKKQDNVCTPEEGMRRLKIIVKAMAERRELSPEQLGINPKDTHHKCSMCDDTGSLSLIRNINEKHYEYAFKCICEAALKLNEKYPEIDLNYGPPEWIQYREWIRK
jgi:hypothetical protein